MLVFLARQVISPALTTQKGASPRFEGDLCLIGADLAHGRHRDRGGELAVGVEFDPDGKLAAPIAMTAVGEVSPDQAQIAFEAGLTSPTAVIAIGAASLPSGSNSTRMTTSMSP